MNGGDKMIDLSCIKQAQDEMIYNMESFFDSLYFKQQDILNSVRYSDNTYDDLMFGYTCFQEGVVAPKLSDELDMYKFDNKHIIKCIRHFDKMIKDLPKDSEVERRRSDLLNENFRSKKDYEEDPKDLQGKESIKLTDDTFYEYFEQCRKILVEPNSEFFKGLSELEKQFDCKFEMPEGFRNSIEKDKRGEWMFGTTLITNMNELNNHMLTISKSKGFKLNGMKIQLIGDVRAILTFTMSNNNTGGARLTSVLLHEIFHNIAHMINVSSSDFIKNSKELLKSTKKDETLPGSTAKFSNFLDSTMSSFKLPKLKSKNKKIAISRLYILSRIKDNPAALKEFEHDIQEDNDPKTREDLEAYVDRLEKKNHFTKIGSIFRALAVLVTIIGMAVGIASGTAIGVVAAVAGGVFLLFKFGLEILRCALIKLQAAIIGKMDVTEEYYADLFAAMYQLPVSFSSYKKYIKLAETGNKDLVDAWASVSRKFHDVIHDEHPATIDRDKCSYNIAKQILSSNKKLKPEVRKYLEGIVADNKGIENIEGEMSKNREKGLSPDAAADLNRYLRMFADKTGSVVTESFIEYFIGGVIDA